jgi:mRNA interferase RelE/StbE
MAAYRIFFRKSVWKDLDDIPKKELRRILNRIERLADNPRPRQAKKMAGIERFRIRQGQYRIIYSIQDDKLMVWIIKIGHRKDIYRR